MHSSRVRHLLVAMIAVLALTAVGAGTAQAAPTWKIEAKEFTGEETFTSKETKAFELKAEKLPTIKCATETDKGKIFGKNKDESTIEFSSCEVVGAAKCAVTVGKSEVNTELLEVGGIVYDKFTPKTEPFAKITITGAECVLILKEEPVTGTACGEVGAEAVNSLVTFSEAIATTCKTELKLGKRKAGLVGVSGEELTSKKVWN